MFSQWRSDALARPRVLSQSRLAIYLPTAVTTEYQLSELCLKIVLLLYYVVG